jgi:hypothetical protein
MAVLRSTHVIGKFLRQIMFKVRVRSECAGGAGEGVRLLSLSVRPSKGQVIRVAFWDTKFR